MSSLTLRDVDEEAAVLKLSMQSLKEYYGLNPGKHEKPAKRIGYQLGLELAKRLTPAPADAEEVVSQLSWYWSRYGMGEMFWTDKENSLLAIQSCSDCLGRSYGAGYVLCPFKEGLLEAVLEAKLNRQVKVREVECCGTGASNCLFKVGASAEG